MATKQTSIISKNKSPEVGVWLSSTSHDDLKLSRRHATHEIRHPEEPPRPPHSLAQWGNGT